MGRIRQWPISCATIRSCSPAAARLELSGSCGWMPSPKLRRHSLRVRRVRCSCRERGGVPERADLYRVPRRVMRPRPAMMPKISPKNSRKNGKKDELQY